MPEPFERLDRAMDGRRLELRLNWRQLADRAGCSYTALRAIRRGEYRPAELTARGIDDALGWGHGSVYAILDGGEPTLLDSVPRASRPAGAQRRAEEAGPPEDPVQYAIERLLERYSPDQVADILDRVLHSYPPEMRDDIRRRLRGEDVGEGEGPAQRAG